MSGFETINKLYLPLKDMFRCNQNLLKYIACDNDYPLSQPDIEDIDGLFDNRIWFRPKVTSTYTGENTCVTVNFLTFKNSNKAIGDFVVVIDIFTHNDKYILKGNDENPFRVINIANEIDTYINGSHGNFLGKCLFDSFKPLYVNDNFSGVEIAYRLSNFNYNFENNKKLV